MIVERHIKQAHGPACGLHIAFEIFQIARPVFTHGKQLLVPVTPDRVQPRIKKVKINVLDRVHAKTVDPGFIQVPSTPADQFLNHLVVI